MYFSPVSITVSRGPSSPAAKRLKEFISLSSGGPGPTGFTEMSSGPVQSFDCSNHQQKHHATAASSVFSRTPSSLHISQHNGKHFNNYSSSVMTNSEKTDHSVVPDDIFEDSDEDVNARLDIGNIKTEMQLTSTNNGCYRIGNNGTEKILSPIGAQVKILRSNNFGKAGEELKQQRPQFTEITQIKIDELTQHWGELNKTAQDKSMQIADANRETIFNETAKSMSEWITDISSQIITTEEDSETDIGLVEINEQMKDQEKKDKELEQKRKMLLDMETHAVKLKEQYPDREDEIEQMQQEVRVKLTQVEAPLAGRRENLMKRKRVRQFLRDIEDEKQWIEEKIQLVQNNGKIGDSLLAVQQLIRRLKTLNNEVDNHRPRIEGVCEEGEAMISENHPQSDKFAAAMKVLWELWDDLQMKLFERFAILEDNLVAQQYLFDASEAEQELYLMSPEKAKDLLDRISEKKLVIPEEVGRDAKSVATYQRKHQAFEQEVHRLGQQIESAVETANHLLPLYAGQKERMICDRRDELLHAWKELQMASEFRKVHLLDAADLHRFLAMVRELINWMYEIRQQMDAKDKPKDVAGVDVLVNNHRSLKAEIDAREENFSICLSLGRTLLNRRHPRETDIREKCIEVVVTRVNLIDQWTERYDYLHLILEVYQFARDAAVAESWLMAQYAYLSCHDLGDNLDETLALLKKHLAFERAAMSQEERFEALKKLTTLELQACQSSLEAQQLKEEDRQRRIQEAIKEFQPPPTPKLQKPVIAPDADGTIEPETSTQQMATPTGAHRSVSAEQPGSDATQRSTTSAPAASSETHEGLLSRKHEWESANKKASGRSWHELYMCLSDGGLHAYKDQKHCREKPSELYHHESVLSVAGSQAAPATDYLKRPNVFRVRLSNGGEYLFQARSEAEMNEWIRKLNAAAGNNGVSSSPPSDSATRSHTLPLHGAQHTGAATGTASSEAGDNSAHHGGNKKKFFTLGRKK